MSRRGPALQIGARAAVVAGAYLAAALVVLATIVALRRLVSPALLQGVLGYFFIASLSSGLDPATVRAAVLRDGAAVATAEGNLSAYLAVSALKGVLAAPILALVWRFADPHLDGAILLWTPLICVAGFAATDLRVLSDLKGRYALAIGLKQGSLAGGLAIVAVLVAIKAPLSWAIGAATLARLALVAAAATAALPSGRGVTDAWRHARALLRDVRWVELATASVIGAVGGSTDRVLGLRFLAPAVYGGYYLVYELVSKFWLIPYMVGPIIFARRAAGGGDDPFIGRVWRLTALAGVTFLAGVAGVLLVVPALVARFVGVSFGWTILAFAAAVVIGSFTQLRIAELQGAGSARRAALITAFGAAVSAVLFFVFIRQFGASGLFMAWLIKSAIELAATLVGGRPGLAPQPL